jgi:hypothetical protein
MFNKFSVSASKFHHLACCAVLALSLAGCGADSTSSMSAQSSAAGAATQPPVVSGAPSTAVTAGAMYRYLPRSSDPESRVLSYDILNKPEWAIFSEASGELTGRPEVSDIGTTSEIEIGVSNGTKRAIVGPFHITVIPEKPATDPVSPTEPGTSPGSGGSVQPTSPATIAGTPSPAVTAGQTYRFRPTVTDPSGETLSYAIVNRPAWAAFNTKTGALSGTPTSANVGVFAHILISVSTNEMPVSLPAFAIQVQPAADSTPTISGSPATVVAAGGDYSFTPVAGDPDGNALTFSVLNAPPWASFDSHTGELSGTAPSSATASLFSNIVIGVSDGTLSASLPAFSIQVQAQSGGGSGGNKGIKFHPGHYIELDPGSGGGGVTGWLATIASLKGAAGVTGVVLWQPWSSLEFAENVYTQGSGSSAQGFAMIDQLLTACKNAGLQFVLAYEDRSFGGPTTYSAPPKAGYFGVLPDYFDTLDGGSPGYLDAPSGTTFQGEGLQQAADVLNPVVTARAVALVTAYGQRYDSNPNFEMFRTPETSDAALTSSGQFDAYVAQFQVWMKAARAAFPTTGLSITANFLDNVGEYTALLGTAVTYSIGIGGPDAYPNISGYPNTFPGTSNVNFNGYVSGTDYRGVLPWIAEVQTPDEGGNASMATLYAEMMTGSLATGGSMQPQYVFWSFNASYMGPNAFTNAQILAFIASVNGAVNSKAPSSY